MNTNTLAVAQANGLSRDRYLSERLLGMIALERTQLVFTNLGLEKSLPKNQGTKKFSMRRYNHLPVGNHRLTEGVIPTALKIEGQEVDCSVNQLGAYIEVTDVAEDIHLDNIRTVYQPELSRHAAEVIEREILASFTDASEYFVGGKLDANALTDTNILTIKDLRIVATTMKNYNRKGHRRFGGKPVCVVHTNVMQDLLDDETLEKKLLVPGNENTPIKNGTLQKYMVYGLYIIETLIAEVKANTGSMNVYTSYVLGEDPYVTLSLGNGGVQWLSSPFKAQAGDPLAQKATVGYKTWFGAKIVDPISITKIYSACSYDVSADFTSDKLGRAAKQI